VLNFLSDNLAIMTLLGLIVVVLILLGVVVWAAVRGADEAKKPQSSQIALLSVDSLKQSFRNAVELIETNVVSRAERYNIPWVLVINEKGGSEGLPLVQSGLQSALSADASMKAAAQGMTWNFFDKGIAVQLQAESLGSTEGDDSDHRTWDEFLGLCRDYRPDRPFDSVVLSVSAHLLLRDDPQALLEMVATAKSLHRRLWLAQNRFALRFPIYLVVSDCDQVAGFSRFASGLPDALRSSILGWSTPYELSAPYQSSWVDEAMNAVVSSLSDASAEMSALELPGEDSASYFLLPSAVERLRGGLKLFADELMRPSAYHEPFILRGFYLTGDCSDSVVLRAQSEATQATASELALDMSALDGAEPLSALVGQDWGVRPAFLKDIFERKVFAETGLVRPSSTQRMKRPMINRTARWLGVGVVGFWSIGLAYSSFRLDTQVSDMVAAISRMNTSAGQGGFKPSDAPADQRRDMEDLSLLAQIDSGKLVSFFMPGSLSYFDPIQDKLQARIEQSFMESALKPVHLGLDARLSELTGVATDPSTGLLIQNAPCTLPAGWDELVGNKTSSGLSVEELAEFSATLQFMTRVEALDRVLQARARLSDVKQRPAGADVKLIMKTLLGFDVLGNEDRLAALFRKYAGNLPPIALAPMQAAASCSLELSLKAIRQKLFVENDLLITENVVVERLNQLVDGSSTGLDTQQSIQSLKSLLEDLQLQEELMTPGKGVWMQKSTMQLGKAFDDLMQRAQTSALIGPEPLAKMIAQGHEQYALFAGEWARLRESESPGLGNGLAWSEKDNKWAFSPERAALSSSLAVLLNQSYLNTPIQKKLPMVGTQSMINWDESKLDKVLLMADMRKKFQTDLLPKFPAAVSSEIDRVVRQAISAHMSSLLTQAMVPMPRGSASVLGGESERSRLSRIQTALLEMGNKAAANDLQALMSDDAMARLRDLDDVLLRSEVYLVRERDFKGWLGEKNPMLQAFAVADSLALSSYVADQQSLLDGMSKEAEKLLPLISQSQSSGLLVRRWQGIVKDLKRYRSKSPSSNLLALEQFVQAGALDLELKNCAEKISVKPVGRNDGDIFSERLQQMQGGLQRRCGELRAIEQQTAWSNFAEAFNRDLAGNSPFTTGTFNAAQGRTAADAITIASVLKLYTRAVLLWPEKSKNTKPAYSASVLRSAEQMEQVRAFMTPLFETDDNATPGYDVSIEFRANQANEVDGNKIIEWRLTIGGQVLRQRDLAKPLRWEPGKDIELSMRIAKDSPTQAMPDLLQPWMAVDDKVVSYRFSDPWALLSFIAKHREPTSSTQRDNRSQLLRFEFPVSTKGASPQQMPVESRAKVFVKLGISPVGKRNLLAWPNVFPATVADWTSP
jgi:type VI secretion system protein ImpL